jgi:tRNA nucleotidyltransferase/poly(A) polymerase
MKVYMVGGAVRDKVMGVEPKDRDYVVVGSSPEEMLALGYEQVGASFPVFLKDGCEYALARTERKTGVGYNGFVTTFDPSITLEDDLIRRDLTINAMAMDLDTGEIIDPYGGKRDIQARVLRHTSAAFAEDPVRVLRTARFAARYSFTIDRSTIVLMKQVAPELNHVPQERVFAEFQKGLMEDAPVNMIEALIQCGALDVDSLRPYRHADKQRLAYVVKSDPLYVRFALVARSFAAGDYETCKVPTDLAKVSAAFNEHFATFLHYQFHTPVVRLTMLNSLRAFSDPDLLRHCVDVFALHVRQAVSSPAEEKRFTDAFFNDVERAKKIDAEAIAASCTNPKDIRQAIFNARLATLV